MTTSINTIVNVDAPIEPGHPAAGAEADRSKVRALAEQFESMLLAQMLKEMRESMAPDDTEGLGAPMMADQMNSELGLALSRSGGVGLSDFLMQALSRLEAQSNTVESGPLSPSAILLDPPSSISLTPDTTSSIPLRLDTATPDAAVGSPTITSDFGWRNDPIQGQPRFHAGRDLRVAYGHEVRAATAGVVTLAGERSGYGLTVVIDHGGGLETRYAHLSSVDVQAGMSVAPGQPIARSGSSGRSTGPHLHFEVRQDGQPIDPESVRGFVPVAGGNGLAAY